MFLTVHVASGLVIGKYIDSPLLAFIFGFISHNILDMIPHDPLCFKSLSGKLSGQTLMKTFLFIELPLITVLLLILTFFHLLVWTPAIFWAIIGAVLMDFLHGFYRLFPIIKPLKIFYQLNHFSHFVFTKKPCIKFRYWFPIQFGLFIIFLLIFLS